MAKKKASEAVENTEVQKTEKIVKPSEEAKVEKPNLEDLVSKITEDNIHKEVGLEDVEKGSEDLKVDVEVEVDTEAPKALLFKDWLLQVYGNVPQKQNQLVRLFAEYLEAIADKPAIDTPHSLGQDSLISFVKETKDKAIYTVKELGELEKAYLGS